jgi:biopolymer transport protein TolR
MKRTLRRLRSQRSEPLSDINVTPFVDILLVVLIAFMISAPLITQSLPIELPQGQLKQATPENRQGNLVVAIDAEENIFFAEQTYSMADFEAFLREEEGLSRNRPVYLQMDKRVAHGFLIRLMLLLKNEGFAQVGLAFNERDL